MSVEAALAVAIDSFRLEAELSLRDGEVVALLGPNGAGKTTLLKALAGLIPLDGGRIEIDSVAVDDPERGVLIPPERRPASLVFQDYLLFPHMSVLDNVAFGLRTQGASKAVARKAGAEWLKRLELEAKAQAKPRDLSGGQAQKVALARALATEPSLLLLDEPLAALDVATRATVRRDLRHHLDEFGGSTVLVTHDPVDALVLASRMIVIEGGGVTQEGTVDEITRRPRSRYVADLAGMNLLKGIGRDNVVSLDSGEGEVVVADSVAGNVFVLIHPHAVSLYASRPEGSARNLWPGQIDGIEKLGERVRVHIGCKFPLVSEVTTTAVAELGLHEGKDVWAGVKATEINVYPA